MTTSWLPTLKTATPQEGFELAVKLARIAVKLTQPDDAIRSELRALYEKDTGQLIASSHVVATHFATISAANGYWLDGAGDSS